MKSGKLLKDIPITEECEIENLGGKWKVVAIGDTHCVVKNVLNPDNRLSLPKGTPLK